jgi:hypothetical protein
MVVAKEHKMKGQRTVLMGMLTLIAAFGLTVTGCASYNQSTPYINLNINPEYTVLGEVTGEASDTVLFGFLPVSVFSADKAKYGWMSYWQLNGIKPYSAWTMNLSNAWYTASTQAVYDALQKKSDADYILAPVFEIEIEDKFIFLNIKVKVRGTAIKFKRT